MHRLYALQKHRRQVRQLDPFGRIRYGFTLKLTGIVSLTTEHGNDVRISAAQSS